MALVSFRLLIGAALTLQLFPIVAHRTGEKRTGFEFSSLEVQI